MAGYVRQSSADIVPTAIIRAAPVNNEYNALRDAFAQASGHKHDGTAAEGAYVPLISDSNAYNKVVVDSTNNRLGFFVNVSSAAAEQVRLAQNVLNPLTDNVFSLGTSSLKFKDLFLAGTATIASLVAAAATRFAIVAVPARKRSLNLRGLVPKLKTLSASGFKTF